MRFGFLHRGRGSCVAILAALLVVLPATARDPDFRSSGSAGLENQGAVGGYASTHVLVKLMPGLVPQNNPDGTITVDEGPIDEAARAWGVSAAEPVLVVPAQNEPLAEKFGLNRTYRFIVPEGTDTAGMAAEFGGLPGIITAEVDGVGGIAQLFPNDPDFPQQWNMHNTGQNGGTVDADIDGPEAWEIYTGADSITIAIIDTGVQADHPDLDGKVISGWNTYNNNDNTDDPHGHGTHVTGIAGSLTDNNIGIAGTNWNVTILAMRCTSVTGSGTESQCAAAITWAADNGADICSMSLQYYTGTTTLENAVNYAHGLGVMLIAATGNNAGNTIAYPAKFANCMGVGATDRKDTWWSGSNYGPEIDVTAPGKEIYSLWKNNGYATINGTSMATPHVSGLAAMLMSYNISISNADIEQIIKDTAEDMGPAGWDEKYGWGRINAHLALVEADPRGDMNCDGAVNGFDIDAFLTALYGVEAYDIEYPDCEWERGDMDGDGDVNGFDIDLFAEKMIGE